MSHNHNHNHHQTGANYNNKFKLGIILNISFVVIEFIFGILYNSLALIADAGHNLSDVIGLAVAWGASILVTKRPTKNFTYGYKKSSIIGAQINSLILLVAIGVIIWEAINRFASPPEVEGTVMILVAGIGVVINGITTYLFFSGKDTDLNIKGAYLHMLSDTLVSVGVVISGIIIIYTNAFWIDPTISIVIAVVILWSTWSLLKASTKLSLDAVPDSINIKNINEYFDSLDEITDYHHLHVWALSTIETALTVHLTKREDISNDLLLQKVNSELIAKFDIPHATIQIENINCEESN
jgi:cobalt-zinc-cadmium efflux system protein